MQYFDFSILIEQYSTDFKVICESEGSYDDSGEYVKGEKTEHTLHGAIMAHSENQIYRSEGKLTSQDRVLIMQAPIDRALHGAEVIHLDRMYKIDSELKSSSEQATESVKKFSGITESIERFDERIAALKDNIKSFGSTIAHPLSTVKNGFSSIKNEISETASKIKNLAQTKMSNLTSNIKEMYSTLSRGQTGAKGFVTALKSIGKVGFEKTISGFQSIKKSIKSITFDKIKSGLSSIKSGTSSVLSGFKSLGSGAQKVASNIKTAFSNVGSKIKSVASNISSAADSITSKLFNIKSLVAGVATGAVVQQSVGIVVDRQNITSQFEVLLGSAEKANERVSELTDFAGMTPFTRDEIFAASKQLQVFTGDALSTGDSLRIIGDVAAGTGQQFEDVALWTGRLYDAMKSGRTVGEMTSRLQEMGAISGEDRTKIENLMQNGSLVKYIGRNSVVNMQIQSFNHSHPNTIAGGCDFDMTLRVVRIAQPSYKSTSTKSNNNTNKTSTTPKSTSIKTGDVVIFTGGNVYVSSTASQPAANRGKSTCKVTIINTNKHSYHLISNDGGKVYGWVDKANVQTKSSTTTKATTSKSTKQVTSGDNKAVYHTVKKGNTVWGLVNNNYKSLGKSVQWVIDNNPKCFSKKGDPTTLIVGSKLLMGYKN